MQFVSDLRSCVRWGREKLALLRMSEMARAEWRQHWLVVLAAAAGMALSAVAPYSTGVMILPLEAEFGWSRATISSGPVITSISGLFVGPFVGLAVDRYGPRRLGIAGAILPCVALALLSTVTASIWTWWLLWVIMAFASSFTKPVIWTAGVSSLFKEGRGLALAVALCGTAFCSTITPILANYLVEEYGWRTAYLCLAAFWAALVVPPVLCFHSSAMDKHRVGARSLQNIGERPAAPSIAVLPGVTAREGLLSWRFVRLAIAAFAMVLGTIPYVVNLVPILVSTGHPRATAAAIAGVIGITSVVGRLISGYLLDRTNANVVAAVSITMPMAAGLLILAAPGSAPAAIIATITLGIGLGAELDSVAYLVTRHFGLRSFGVLFGTIGGLLALATGTGPMIVNFIYDVTRSYTAALWMQVPICTLAAGLFLSLGRYRTFDAPPRAPMSKAHT